MMLNLTPSPRILRMALLILVAITLLAVLAGCGHGGGGY
jgi:predicted small lipoprotein YifL